jgi:single-stranded-DNA-specific exonuclease
MAYAGRRWQLLTPPSPEVFRELRDFPPLLATLLYHRNIATAEQAADFLETSWEKRHNPFEMRDMDRAVDRIRLALDRNESIVVYGDFDTDGVTGVTLLMQMLSALGGRVQPYIPRREGEGYGLNIGAIERLSAAGAQLLITVDCGISNVQEIERANELGLEVVVFDHHRVPPVLPRAVAVVNPKREDCGYPFKGLCGVGVAFKLFEAFYKSFPEYRSRLRARDVLDVVALGTIADMMPLTGENRVLVRYGLQALNETQRPGLLALMEVASLKQGQLDSMSVAFGLAPRINAAGRLEEAIHAYDLLLAPTIEEARRRALQINETNTERRALMMSTQETARAMVLASGRQHNRIIVICGEGFHHGVVGLVAGRLAEEFHRPVLVMGREELTSRGSARSIPGFNIVETLAECGELFVKYGGHAAAAGFTISNENLEELERRLLKLAEGRLGDDMLTPVVMVDAEARLSDLNEELLDMIGRLAPFGQENQQPLFMSRRLQVLDAKTVGAEGQHLKLRVTQPGGRPMDAIAFRHGRWMAELARRPAIDLVYSFEANEWNGSRRLQLKVKDLRLSEEP